jgi:FtsP/CotA-like multicopper oxidase with cupredoxin domain
MKETVGDRGDPSAQRAITRGRALGVLAGAVGATAGLTSLRGPVEAAGATGAVHDHGAAGADHSGFTPGGVVDHERNGFDPSVIVRDFDWGKVSKLPDGRTLREWELTAVDKEIEVAPGVFYAAWVFDGRVPGPTLRCVEGDRLRIRFANGSAHPHTVHFHGIHPDVMDGVPGIGEEIGGGLIQPGEAFTYEFDAEPFGLHLYHCHANPLAAHIAKGLYGTFIVDPKQGRPEADELVMVMNAFDTNFDFSNEVYAVNTVGFHYVNEPIRVQRGELVRIYLVNILEYDPINSFHLHANFFHYFPTGTSLQPVEYTDTISQVQGQRGILELRFPHPGKYMFHAHKTEFAELGWMGFFEVLG